jgi:hypothetical protein
MGSSGSKDILQRLVGGRCEVESCHCVAVSSKRCGEMVRQTTPQHGRIHQDKKQPWALIERQQMREASPVFLCI